MPRNIFVMFGILLTVAAVSNSMPSSRTKYCGTHLTDALRLACEQNGYNTPPWADPTNNSKAKYAKYELNVGVATECCYIGCSWRTLISYCAGPRVKKSKKSSGDEIIAILNSINSQSSTTTESSVIGGGLAAVAPEVNLESVRRSAPLFGTVSPEYLRLPRTLDEIPPLFQGMQGY